MAGTTPAQAWQQLRAGNERFTTGQVRHPHTEPADRARLADGQRPHAVVLGCSDSRVPPDIVFDQGLGDLFVVRTAGHALDPSVIGSIEYGVVYLEAPLIVVLGHDSCGAIAATLEAMDDFEVPLGSMRDLVERIVPSILSARKDGLHTVADFEARHVQETAARLIETSAIVSSGLSAKTLAVVEATYQLRDGKAVLRSVYGDIGDEPAAEDALPLLAA
jgi:carbonic anhydrase